MTESERERTEAAIVNRLEHRLNWAVQRLRWGESDFETVAQMIAQRVDEARQELAEVRRKECG